MKKTTYFTFIWEAFLKIGVPFTIISLALGLLTFFDIGANTELSLGDFFVGICILILLLWLFMVASWLIFKKVEEGYAKLPNIDTAYGPGEHFSNADATIIVPNPGILENNTTIAIYESSGREDLIGLGYVEKQREDGCVEVVSYSIIPGNENSIWENIQKGDKQTLKNILLKLFIPWQHISMSYSEKEDAEVKNLIDQSSSVTEDGGLKI